MWGGAESMEEEEGDHGDLEAVEGAEEEEIVCDEAESPEEEGGDHGDPEADRSSLPSTSEMEVREVDLHEDEAEPGRNWNWNWMGAWDPSTMNGWGTDDSEAWPWDGAAHWSNAEEEDQWLAEDGDAEDLPPLEEIPVTPANDDPMWRRVAAATGAAPWRSLAWRQFRIPPTPRVFSLFSGARQPVASNEVREQRRREAAAQRRLESRRVQPLQPRGMQGWTPTGSPTDSQYEPTSLACLHVTPSEPWSPTSAGGEMQEGEQSGNEAVGGADEASDAATEEA